jgi:hypothetical protein
MVRRFMGAPFTNQVHGSLMVRQAHHEECKPVLILSLSKDADASTAQQPREIRLNLEAKASSQEPRATPVSESEIAASHG